MPDPVTFALSWDDTGEHLYETGVDHGVLYPMTNGEYGAGVVWNGLSSVEESPSGADNNAVWADNIKYLNLTSAEDYGLTITAYTYPEEFEECDGSRQPSPGVFIGQQERKKFGFSWRTKIGNDVDGADHGYKLHLVYNCTAAPSSRSHQTVNESPEATEMSWEVSTTPQNVGGNYKPTAHLVIDSTKANATKLAALEAILYGTAGTNGTAARMPLPAEVISTLAA